MKKLRSVICLFMALLMLCSMFAGCTQETAELPDEEIPVSTDTDTGTVMDDVSDDDVSDDEVSEEAVPEKVLRLSANGIETYDNGYMRTDLTALELSVLMGNGTNLGNTMEAVNFELGNYTDDISKYETQWGQPITTQEILNAIKANGFDSIRIPVAWMTNATTLSTNGDYTISDAYFDRVEEIINYALNADMYVIVNDHWDGGWYGMFGSEREDTRNLAREAYIGMWTQIAERYKEYSDYLIFEGANEELGNRYDENSPLYCSDSETNYFDPDERYALTNEINQLFVDTVRATGGNNANRFLLIPGYGTNIHDSNDSRYVMPTDPAKNKLLISVHYYEPGSYTTAESPSRWGTKSDYEEMEAALGKMSKFTEQGYAVVFGEYGAYPTKDGKPKENNIAYLEYFLDICDYYGFASCLWDCSGIFVRKDLEMVHPDFRELYVNRNYAAQSSMTEDEIKSAAQARMKEKIENAPVTYNAGAVNLTDSNAAAWLMWTAGDANVSNHAGNEYDPNDISVGLVNTDAEITKEGTYTVGLDFTGTTVGYSNSIIFTAVGIANGEKLFPGYVIDIKEVLINGKAIELCAVPYTTSDGNNCTRVNLYNAWITSTPDTTRTATGSAEGISACLLDLNDPVMNRIETIYVTFYYGPQK